MRGIYKFYQGGEQIGDVVSINDPLKNMAPSTHKYFVVEMSHTYDKGLKTSFTLRRAKI